LRAPLIERLQVNRAVLKQTLRDTPATLLPADGGWLAIVQLPATEEDGGHSAVRLLQHQGVLVQPGWLYDLPLGESWVVSLLPPPTLFASAAHRMQGWLAG
jgi:aspartate/methionine/tyrosine aminotransferase